MKHCNKCGTDKPLDQFSKRKYKNGKMGVQSYCKECDTIWRRKYYRSHSQTRRRLNISDEYYAQLMNTTHCQTCGVEMTKKCIDHDHKTGKVRGVLCNNCNRCLGLLKDDLTVVKSLIKYLET